MLVSARVQPRSLGDYLVLSRLRSLSARSTACSPSSLPRNPYQVEDFTSTLAPPMLPPHLAEAGGSPDPAGGSSLPWVHVKLSSVSFPWRLASAPSSISLKVSSQHLREGDALTPPAAVQLLALLVSCTSAQSINITSLVSYLLPSGSLNTSIILGESLTFPPFTTTILTNDSHALVTTNTTKPFSFIGWVALGFGTTMSEASIVVLWPSANGFSWTLSHRSTTEHCRQSG